ncbi:MAG: endonuclease domain-containing protein [Bacteroidales bacterium]|nr:endonuclease domain-containing protein [Bacteroidales bacterium]
MESWYATSSPDRYDVLKGYAKVNRHNMTVAEQLLWDELRNGKTGCKFRRQHPIGDYIADFVCIEKRLVIEVDGGYHNTMEQRQDDQMRSVDIEKMGYLVMRFSNEDVEYDLSAVMTEIKNKLKENKQNTHFLPSPVGEGQGVRLN